MPGTMAHRAKLRALLDQHEAQLQGEAGGPQQSREERDRLHEIVNQALQEPTFALMEVIELLEDLVQRPVVGHDAVYEHLDHYQSLLVHRVAHRAYQLGLRAGSPEANEKGQA